MVRTKNGMIEGIDRGDYVEYRGIPYAKPPVGDLRWKEPAAMENWDGVLKAVDFRNRCMQKDLQMEPFTGDFYSDPEFIPPMNEDCLYMNISVPKKKEEGRLPVAFWIHGGAFARGYNCEMEFDGKEYCRRGVIYISVEYRCNAFGFLAHPWLTEESNRHVSGNYALLDQIAALQWVSDNIEAFGGDPRNITVFGQSAGAISTQALVSSELTGTMIAKAIMQSGGYYRQGLADDVPVMTLGQQEEIGKEFADILGADSLDEMRKIPAEKILQAVDELTKQRAKTSRGLFFVPIQDGYVLKGDYASLMDRAEIRKIPYMIGTTKNDITVTKDNLENHTFSPLYNGSVLFSRKMEEIGSSPAYVYYFTHDLPGDEFGAWHSCELWYMFGTLDRCWRPWKKEDYDLSRRMLDYWTNFMKTGDPNSRGLERWEPCSISNPTVFEFGGRSEQSSNHD